MINDILRRRKRKSVREPTARKSHTRENTRRRDHERFDDTMSRYRRDWSRDDIRHRDESPYRPRITLADALSDFVAALNVNGSPRHYKGQSDMRKKTRDHSTMRNIKPTKRREEYPYDGYASDGYYGHIAAATNGKRREPEDTSTPTRTTAGTVVNSSDPVQPVEGCPIRYTTVSSGASYVNKYTTPENAKLSAN
ncbi:LOW QUALITY PROTEIN: hypothetical protein PHMEG_0007457 [Phytophthora megakarya]|uniref:Uncharacterized protein n=1 Tax=Phytophthora megakarya TaxID=4795 RepID=A0A225WL66_9STRA|nr:LOW QUALITY PROTEIN: hypothetical protein PHMEG_0007457 [Phytophthora megakarya]